MTTNPITWNMVTSGNRIFHIFPRLFVSDRCRRRTICHLIDEPRMTLTTNLFIWIFFGIFSISLLPDQFSINQTKTKTKHTKNIQFRFVQKILLYTIVFYVSQFNHVFRVKRKLESKTHTNIHTHTIHIREHIRQICVCVLWECFPSKESIVKFLIKMM